MSDTSSGRFIAMTLSVTKVGTPSRRSVPGVLPDSNDSDAISITSSTNWKATPIFSPKIVSVSLISSGAPETIAPKRAEAAIKEPVLSATTPR